MMSEMCFKIFQDKGGDGDRWNKIGEMFLTVTVEPRLYIHGHSYAPLSAFVYV